MKRLTLESLMAEYEAKNSTPTGVRVRMMEEYLADDAGYGVIVQWKKSGIWIGSLRKMEFFPEYDDAVRRALELVAVLREDCPDLNAHARMCADRPEWKEGHRRG